jgi:hypothetical protein
MPTSNLLRALSVVVACAGMLVGGCFSDDVTPQNTAIAGKWAVACHPVNEDCPDFAISFDAYGDITDFDLDGHKGPQRGTGEIADAALFFIVGVGTVYEFSGKLDGGGRSASGTVINYDYDGHQKTTAAVATRTKAGE